MSLQEYNWLSGFGSNKKAQSALLSGALLGLGAGYLLWANKDA